MNIKTVSEHLLMASAFVLFLAQGFDFVAQEKPVPPPKGYQRPINAKEFRFPNTDDKGPTVTNGDDVKAAISKVKVTKPKAEGKEPAKARRRGSDTRDWCIVGNYKGLCGMWQFDNYDFASTYNTCGQAAAATIITHWQGQQKNDQFKKDLAKFLYSAYGPDNALGMFGTSWQQVVNSVIVPYKMGWRKVSGEADLRQELDRKIPVVVMLDAARMVERGYPYKTFGIAGHWVVVYGYNDDYYFITNHSDNWIRRSDFNEVWSTWLHDKVDGRNRGYVFWK